MNYIVFSNLKKNTKTMKKEIWFPQLPHYNSQKPNFQSTRHKIKEKKCPIQTNKINRNNLRGSPRFRLTRQ